MDEAVVGLFKAWSRCIVFGLLLVSACALSAPRDSALIRTARGSEIVLLNGEEVSERRAILPPGDHTLRFQMQTGLRLFSPRCGVELRLKPGVAYTFSTELEDVRLPDGVLGARWRKLDANGVLSVLEPAKEPRRIVLPCSACVIYRANNAREEAVSCHRYRAMVRIEELCSARSATTFEQCVRDGETLVLAWYSATNGLMLFVPGLLAEYSSDEHLDASRACIDGDTSDVVGCLADRGWEAVP